MNGDTDLSVVIPVHNAVSTLTSLVDDLLDAVGITVQVILVDDRSTDGSEELVRELGTTRRSVVSLFHRENRGAGIARNTGLGAVTGRYLLYFDADDVVHTDALTAAIGALDDTSADLAIMTYKYRRGGARHEGMNNQDVELWRRLVGDQPMHRGNLDGMPELLRLSNYPWYKVLRTDTYRAAGIKFGSTVVHNDILGHWYSILFADEILLLNQDICTHVVEVGGSNLTNRQDRQRLALFDALDETYDMLAKHSSLRSRYSHHYWNTVVRTADWARERVSGALLIEFNDRLQQHLLRMNLADFARIRTRRDPALADAVVRKALG